MVACMTPQKQSHLPARLGYDGRNIPSVFTHPNNICRNLEIYIILTHSNITLIVKHSVVSFRLQCSQPRHKAGQGLGMRLENIQYSGTQIRSKCVLIKYAHLGEKAAHLPMKELTSTPSISAMDVNLYWTVGRLPTASVH